MQMPRSRIWRANSRRVSVPANDVRLPPFRSRYFDIYNDLQRCERACTVKTDLTASRRSKTRVSSIGDEPSDTLHPSPRWDIGISIFFYAMYTRFRLYGENSLPFGSRVALKSRKVDR